MYLRKIKIIYNLEQIVKTNNMRRCDHVVTVLRHISTQLFPNPTVMTPLVQHSSPLGASGISSMTFGSREKINHVALNTP